MPQHMDGGLDLLDRQIIDVEGAAVGKVDDVELSEPTAGEPPVITALLLGPEAYGYRIGGTIGRWIRGIGISLADTSKPIRIPLELVAEIGVCVQLKVTAEELSRPDRVEKWLFRNFIGRIPGATDEAE